MWYHGWREKVWLQLEQQWDIIIIGGGITGAGILREATRAGLRTLLLDAGDFASGTSSRSSKLVHGGLRYLKNAQVKITLESVHERQRLLAEGKGLIKQLGFLYAHLENDKLPGWVFGLGLVVYDLFARTWLHRHYDKLDMRELCPPLTTPVLIDGYRFFDATTDDARLVLRVIREAVLDGSLALNYARVENLLTTQNGIVCGVAITDQSGDLSGRSMEIKSNIIINATGVDGDTLRSQLKKPHRLRPIRGSHLIIPKNRLSISRAVSFNHPDDQRVVFTIPWENVIIFGTTDVDHGDKTTINPSISGEEVEYLLHGLNHVFPDQNLTLGDIQCTYSGIRPTVDTGKKDPSKESREHVIWYEDGLLTVSGGKLTTFRLMARDALRAVRNKLPEKFNFDRYQPILNPISEDIVKAVESLPSPTQSRLYGRYGSDLPNLLAISQDNELSHIAETPYLWAELRWAAKAEGVVHLDDLLLRRVRLGLLLPEGGKQQMKKIRKIVQPELGWKNRQWKNEEKQYFSLWEQSHSISK